MAITMTDTMDTHDIHALTKTTGPRVKSRSADPVIVDMCEMSSLLVSGDIRADVNDITQLTSKWLA
jgi:hypothetical protein